MLLGLYLSCSLRIIKKMKVWQVLLFCRRLKRFVFAFMFNFNINPNKINIFECNTCFKNYEIVFCCHSA